MAFRLTLTAKLALLPSGEVITAESSTTVADTSGIAGAIDTLTPTLARVLGATEAAPVVQAAAPAPEPVKAAAPAPRPAPHPPVDFEQIGKELDDILARNHA